MIKLLKIGKRIRQNFQSKSLDENKNVTWNVPKELEEFKAVAVDTLLWQVSEIVKKASGGKVSDLITAISKIQVLQMHLTLKGTPKNQIDELPQTTKNIITKMDELYNAGYADSEKALNTITAVLEEREKLYAKIPKIMSATTHEEVIAILNED